MKKFKYLFLCLFMLGLFLVSCDKKEDSPVVDTPATDTPSNEQEKPTEPEKPVEVEKPNLNGQVKLNSIYYEEVAEQTTETTRKGMSFKLTTTQSNTIDYQYVVVDKEEIITLVIKLDNPKDYHIFDFTLTCDDENAKILINEEYKLISEQKSINWLGGNNVEFKVKIQLTNDLEDTEINITNIYFSDRETGENVYTADLNNKGTFYVYKIIEHIEFEVLDTENKGLWYQVSELDPRIKNLVIEVYDIAKTKTGELYQEDIVDNKIWAKSINLVITFDVEISDTFTYTAEKKEINIDFWNDDKYAEIRDKFINS